MDWSGTLANRTTTCVDGANMNYHVGNYYNWTAAVAMSDSSQYTNYVDVNQSICPAGWMLPKDGVTYGSGSLQYLVNQAGLTAGVSGDIHVAPVYFVYGGGWLGHSDVVGAEGDYWSSVATAYNLQAHAYAFAFESAMSGSVVSGELARQGGYSVRCLVR